MDVIGLISDTYLILFTRKIAHKRGGFELIFKKSEINCLHGVVYLYVGNQQITTERN